MIGATEGKYISSDAVFTIAPNATFDMTIVSGTITLNETLWYTMEGQTLTIAEAATFVIPAGKTLYVNGSKVVVNGTAANFGTLILANGAHLKGDVAGTFQMAGGTFETSEYVMIGATEGKYLSTDAVFTIAPNATLDMTVTSGTITLNDDDWWTLAGQTLVIAKDAKFVVPAGKNINVQGTVIVEGTAVTEGTVTLYNKTATVKAAEGLNVITVAGDIVLYEDGTYKVHDHSYTSAVTDPTCTEKGFTTHTCTCGDEYVDNYVDATDHAYGEWIDNDENHKKICANDASHIVYADHAHESVYYGPTETENAYTVYTCVCGNTYTVVEEGTMLHIAVNKVTGESYADLQAALNAAAKGETVKLLKDTAAEEIRVGSGKTLDLNGKKLTVTESFSASFKSTQITDSANGAGLLVVNGADLALNTDNDYLPVWTDEGIRFVSVDFKKSAKATGENSAEYKFYLNMKSAETILDDLLKSGVTGVALRIKVSYTTASGMKATQYFQLSEANMQEYLEKWDSGMVTLNVNGIAGKQNVTFSAEIVSTLPNGTAVVVGTPGEAI